MRGYKNYNLFLHIPPHYFTAGSRFLLEKNASGGEEPNASGYKMRGL
jgi:hypothetical protein